MKYFCEKICIVQEPAVYLYYQIKRNKIMKSKFNLRSIFSHAWRIVRDELVSIAEALKAAWAAAKRTPAKNLFELAERLGKKVWEKGTIQRVYLNIGYNTNKVKTTCYIHNVGNDLAAAFKIEVFVDCASQSYSWIKNEKERVAELAGEILKKAM